jgi:hypothetical protein
VLVAHHMHTHVLMAAYARADTASGQGVTTGKCPDSDFCIGLTSDVCSCNASGCCQVDHLPSCSEPLEQGGNQVGLALQVRGSARHLDVSWSIRWHDSLMQTTMID